MYADQDLDRVLRSTSIASLNLGAGTDKGKEKTREKGKEKEEVNRNKGKEKEKTRDNDQAASTNEFGQLIHPISSADTLEGIAVKYGVQLSELKRVNKLWTKGDMFARKYLIIPEAQDWGNSIQDLIWRFTSVTKCKDYEAELYLQRTNFNFNEALRVFREDNAKPKNRSQKRENGESTHDLERHGSDIPQYLAGYQQEEGKVRLRQVERKVKERLEKEEDKLFDL